MHSPLLEQGLPGGSSLLPGVAFAQVLLLKGATRPSRAGRRLQGPQAPGTRIRHQHVQGQSTGHVAGGSPTEVLASTLRSWL